jgi:isoquinoline 1-oxidoreductase subunit alpha
VVVASNADTVQIAMTLSTDSAAREALVAQAQARVQQQGQEPAATAPTPRLSAGAADEPGEDPAEKRYEELARGVKKLQDLQTLGVPLGWKDKPWKEVRKPFWWDGFRDTISKLIGLLLTVLAVSLGAPFWFDLLNKIVNIVWDRHAPPDGDRGGTEKEVTEYTIEYNIVDNSKQPLLQWDQLCGRVLTYEEASCGVSLRRAGPKPSGVVPCATLKAFLFSRVRGTEHTTTNKGVGMVSLQVNGKKYSLDVAPDTPLLWVIRDHLKLTGTKFGCGIGECGSCTVHVDGKARRSCGITVAEVQGKKITTIEGLPQNHPVKRAWIQEQVAQCGYCQPGTIMQVAALISEAPKPDADKIINAMDDVLCRCGSYPRIKKGIKTAVAMVKKEGRKA